MIEKHIYFYVTVAHSLSSQQLLSNFCTIVNSGDFNEQMPQQSVMNDEVIDIWIINFLTSDRHKQYQSYPNRPVNLMPGGWHASTSRH